MNETLTILYIGTTPRRNEVLQAYIRRQVTELGWSIHAEYYLPTLDPSIPLELQRDLEAEARYLIVTAEDSFALTGRILSTLGDQALLLSPAGILAPAGASDVREEGYTLRIGRAVVTVVRSGGETPCPPLPLEPRGGKVWHCFPSDAQEEKRLAEALRIGGSEGSEETRILPGWIRIRVCGEEHIGPMEKALRQARVRTLPRPTLVRGLIDYLSAAGKSLTFAESCTGGRLAAAITSESGSSAILEGSYVTYANRIKAGWLGVRESTLKAYGAVSAECVREMAAGAQSNLGADIAVAISGIAGPTGAVPGKPVGTVYLCVRNGFHSRVVRLRLSGDRNAVQEQAVLHALKLIVESEEKFFEFFSKNS
jgi:nicotinamide-nucleotide amidase